MSARSRDEACRTLVGGHWLVCGISLHAARKCVEDAGMRCAGWASPFGPPHNGPVLTARGEVDMTVILPGAGPIVLAPVDDRDAALLGLTPAQEARG